MNIKNLILLCSLLTSGTITAAPFGFCSSELDEISPTNIGEKSVTIENIEITHNIRINGEWGMGINVDFEANNLNGINCEIAAYFYFNSEERLRDFNGQYTTSDGQVYTREGFRPRFDSSVYTKKCLFIPYKELHIDEGERYYLKVVVAAKVSDSRYPKEHLGWSNYTPFNVKLQ